MTGFVSVTADGDYDLCSLVQGTMVTISWETLNGASIALKVKRQNPDASKTSTLPVQNGQFDGDLLDDQGNDQNSFNVWVGGGTLIATVTDFDDDFDLMVDP